MNTEGHLPPQYFFLKFNFFIILNEVKESK